MGSDLGNTPARRFPPVWLVLILLFSCLLVHPQSDQLAQGRALPLNRFQASRHAQTDSAGFYFMPTAIGDDYFDGTSPMARVRRHFALARRAGVKYLRCAFSWNGIEKSAGHYDWQFWDNLVSLAAQNHIQLIPYVAYTPAWAARDKKDFWKQPPRDPSLYADFMYTIASRYRGHIRSWEIWNEPDNKDYWMGTADEFATLTIAAAKRIRQADPSAVLVLGGMADGPSDFVRTLIKKHHLDRYVDVVAMHAYPESWLNGPAEFIFNRWVPEMSKMIAADGSGDDLWLNEMGYPDYRFRPNEASVYGTSVFYRYEHTRRYQATMLFKMATMALASEKISLAGWYRIDDFPNTEKRLGPDFVNYHLGVVDWRGRPKPALFALSFFNRLFQQPTRFLHLHVTRRADSQSVVKIFQRQDGRLIIVGWLRSSTRNEVKQKTGMLLDRRSEVISVQLPCSESQLDAAYDAEGSRLATRARVQGGYLSAIRLTGERVFIAELSCAAPSSGPGHSAAVGQGSIPR